jgi:hypothetical protein
MPSLWAALGSVESRYWKSGHRLGLMSSLELDWRKHAKRRVTTLAVMEDLEVLEDRVGQLDRFDATLETPASDEVGPQRESLVPQEGPAFAHLSVIKRGNGPQLACLAPLTAYPNVALGGMSDGSAKASSPDARARTTECGDPMSEYHHSHPHQHGRRGLHDHYHGHHGTAPSRWPAPPDWRHWFAEHAHIHPDPLDEARLAAPPAPGR